MNQPEDFHPQTEFPEQLVRDTAEDKLDSDPIKFEEDARKLETSLLGRATKKEWRPIRRVQPEVRGDTEEA